MMTHLRCGLFLMVIYFSIASFGNDNGQIQVEAINMVYSNIVQRLDYEYRGPYDARSLGDKVFSLDYSSAFKRMIVFLNRDLHIKTTDPRLFNITIEFQTD